MRPTIAASDAESLLEAIFAQARDPVGLSADNIIRMVNPSMVRLFGYASADAMIGRPFLDLLATEERNAILSFVKRRSEGAEVPGHYTPWAVRADGSRFRVEVRTTTFRLDGVSFALALLRDLGEDKRSAEELYDAIFARNTAVKLLIDPADGKIVDANSAAVDFYGWSADELRAMRITDINLLTPVEVAAEMESARTGERTYFRFRHRTATGDVRHVDVHSGPVEVAGRHLLLSIVQDTTSREALEVQLRRAHRLEAVGRLAGGVAHDFNNLLTIILTSADLVAGEVSSDGPAQRMLEDLTDAAERASDLTGRLLAVGQRQQLVPRVVDLSLMVRGLERLLLTAVGTRIELRLQLSDGQLTEADPGQLDRVVTNLVLNATQAIDGSGTIVITVRPAPRAHEVELSVTDDGRGMDAATQLRVFEPFFTTRSGGRGTGLGLATAYGIVTQSGGTIEVQSTLGAGSTFTVCLPRARESTTPLVLLVEDDDGLRDLLAQGLRVAGFQVAVRSNGAEALAIDDEVLAEIGVLVTDQTMPGATGLQVAAGLRGRRPDLPIVVISGNMPPKERAQLPPGSVFLAKPFSRPELAAAIREVVDRANDR